MVDSDSSDIDWSRGVRQTPAPSTPPRSPAVGEPTVGSSDKTRKRCLKTITRKEQAGRASQAAQLARLKRKKQCLDKALKKALADVELKSSLGWFLITISPDQLAS